MNEEKTLETHAIDCDMGLDCSCELAALEAERAVRLEIVGDEYDPDWRGIRSPWRLVTSCCPGGGICLSRKEYDAQMKQPDATWRCPEHFLFDPTSEASWDDEWHEDFLELFGYAVTLDGKPVSS